MVRETVIRPGEELLTIPQAARVYGVVAMTMRIWVLEGRLPAKRAGRMIFVRRADVEAYKEERAKSKKAASA